MPIDRKPPFEPILAKVMPAARRITLSLRERILRLASQRLPTSAFLERARRLILESEPAREQLLSTSLIAAYFRPAEKLVALNPHFIPNPSPPIIPPALPPILGEPPLEDGPPIRFPLIERAAKSLFDREVFTRQDFDSLDVETKRAAFTVARVDSLETLGRLQDLVGQAAAEGHTLREFKRGAEIVLEDSPLSDAHLETVFRTNLATAYSVGQRELLDQPLVADEFPYVMWTATHDARTRPDHLAMEKAGIGGSAIYRADDPQLRRVWPPAGYRCRCHVIPLQLEDAASYGVREAEKWLKTGQPPALPAWVKSVPIELPRGWVSAGVVVAA